MLNGKNLAESRHGEDALHFVRQVPQHEISTFRNDFLAQVEEHTQATARYVGELVEYQSEVLVCLSEEGFEVILAILGSNSVEASDDLGFDVVAILVDFNFHILVSC